MARRCVDEGERKRTTSISVASWVLDEIEGLPNKSDFIQEALVEKLHTGSSSGISLVDRKRLRSEFIALCGDVIGYRHRLLKSTLESYIERVDRDIAQITERVGSREGELAALKEVAVELKGMRSLLAGEVSKLVADSDNDLYDKVIGYIGMAYEGLDAEGNEVEAQV